MPEADDRRRRILLRRRASTRSANSRPKAFPSSAMSASSRRGRPGPAASRRSARPPPKRCRSMSTSSSSRRPGRSAAEIEVVPARVAAEISKRTSLFLMSMGAGSGCDAQYLFAEDVLGYSRGHQPRHAKVYRNFRAEYDRLQRERVAAFKEFRADVESRRLSGGETPRADRRRRVRGVHEGAAEVENAIHALQRGSQQFDISGHALAAGDLANIEGDASALVKSSVRGVANLGLGEINVRAAVIANDETIAALFSVHLGFDRPGKANRRARLRRHGLRPGDDVLGLRVSSEFDAGALPRAA